jgi:predicted esterase
MPPAADLGFIHRHVAAKHPAANLTLLLLHGTGGNENDLIPLGWELAPGAAMLSPRGKVLEQGMPRFFRRFAEGVLDLEDLRVRADELAAFVRAAEAQYGLPPGRTVAVGYSNGANIAAGLLLLHPELLAGAVLFRAMVTVEPDPPPSLAGTAVFLAAGRHDPIVPGRDTERLAAQLERAGADVTLRWQETGHGLTRQDVSDAAAWLRTHFPSQAARR